VALDAGEVHALFEARWRTVVRLAGLLGADDAEDVVAESFARLYMHRSAVRSVEAGAAYLNRTVVNLVRDRQRRRELATRKQFLTHPSMANGNAPVDSKIVEVVNTLPLRQREAVVLRYWLDMNERDMAAAMGITVGSVKTHLSRALNALRPILEKDSS
jgi:RNA polymerase sigma factor (sigma-70 family)